jgi:hypothetical protein
MTLAEIALPFSATARRSSGVPVEEQIAIPCDLMSDDGSSGACHICRTVEVFARQVIFCRTVDVFRGSSLARIWGDTPQITACFSNLKEKYRGEDYDCRGCNTCHGYGGRRC